MFNPRLRALSRPLTSSLRRTYASRPPPPSSSGGGGGSIGTSLLVGATAIAMFGLIAGQRDGAKAYGAAQAKKAGPKSVKVVEDVEDSPAPAIIERKEAEAKESRESAPRSSEPAGSTSESSSPSANQSAFNEETGEINWDCPCLGGMADGPCGEEFKAAFSCFVFSEAEPKGVDCVEKFRGMQDCFRRYPDIYGEDHPFVQAYKVEIDDDEDEPSSPSTGSQSDTIKPTEVPAPAVPTPAETEEAAAPVGTEDVGAVDSIPPVAAQPTEA